MMCHHLLVIGFSYFLLASNIAVRALFRHDNDILQDDHIEQDPICGTVRTTDTSCPVSSFGKWYLCNNTCFYHSGNVTNDWFTALLDCESYGGHLASATDEEELDIMKRLSFYNFDDKNVWIGLVKMTEATFGPDAQYEWIDGSNLTVRNWEPGQPVSPNAGYSCTQQIYSNGYWTLASCVDKAAYLCKVQLASPSLPTTTRATIPRSTTQMSNTSNASYIDNQLIKGSFEKQIETSSCPVSGDGWWKMSSENDFCYYHSCLKVTNWFQSFIDCEDLGAHLTSIFDKTENDFLSGFAADAQHTKNCAGEPILIGLANNDGENGFEWMDGTGTLTDQGFNSWIPDPPDNDNITKLVAAFHSSGSWSLNSLYSKFPYVCKMPLMTKLDPAKPVPHHGLSKGAIAACVIVPVIAILIIIIAGILLYKYRSHLPCKKSQQSINSQSSRKLRNPFGTIKQMFSRSSNAAEAGKGVDNEGYNDPSSVHRKTTPTEVLPGRQDLPLRPLDNGQSEHPVVMRPPSDQGAYDNRSTLPLRDTRTQSQKFWDIQLADFEDDDWHAGRSSDTAPQT